MNPRGERIGYPCRVVWKARERYVVWLQDDLEGFLRTPDGRLVASAIPEELPARGAEAGVTLAAERLDLDFDRLRTWVFVPRVESLRGGPFSVLWNLLDELAGAFVGGDGEFLRRSEAARAVRWKLRPKPASCLDPPDFPATHWTTEEIDELRGVFRSGLALLDAELFRVDGAGA